MSQLPAYALASRALLESIDNSLKDIAASQALQAAETADWQDVQNIVRRGLGSKAFPVGTQLKYTHTVYGELILDVIGHDIDADPTGQSDHSMTLLLHTLLEGTQFDAPEALYYAESELAAGTYHYDDNGVTRQFMLANAVPAGGQICISAFDGNNAPYGATQVKTYSGPTSTTVIETATVTEGSGGTALASANHWHRARWGSNNWEESGIRQWLNATGAASTWWTPKTNYCRPYSNASRPGFLNGVPADFLAVIGEADHVSAKNTITDGGGSVTTREKIFLLSRKEIFGTGENSIDEGTQYPYFAGLTDAQRIKYFSNGTPYHWWLRSPYSGDAYHVRLVNSTGALYDGIALYGYGVAAACSIY